MCIRDRGKITIIAVIKDNFSAASVLLKLSLIITLAIDMQAAAPSPWTNLKINKNSILGEKTEVILDATKRKLPVKRMGLLPYLSDKNPKTNCPTPAAIMKTVKVNWTISEVRLKSAFIIVIEGVIKPIPTTTEALANANTKINSLLFFKDNFLKDLIITINDY